MKRLFLSFGCLSAILAGCHSESLPAKSDAVPEIPEPASSVTRREAIQTAYAYVNLAWQAQTRHIKHGQDPLGQWVDTPDASVQDTLGSAMWWKPGRNIGMPYKWGGFDTPQQFVNRLQHDSTVYAGDYASDSKIAGGDYAVSGYAAGIDCSGLVSRCWRLPRPYSTRELAALCQPLDSFSALKPGDIALKPGVHVILFVKWADAERQSFYAIEAGGVPHWKCYCYRIHVQTLTRLEYKPWTYRNMR